MFKYPEAVPVYFDQQYKSDRIQITLQYEPLAKPGGSSHIIKVNFKASGSRRIAAVQLRITAHDNEVKDVQPQSSETGPEQKSEFTSTEDYEKKHQWGFRAGIHKTAKFGFQSDSSNTASRSTKASGTRSSKATITGQRMRKFTENDTADWNLKEAKTCYGGDGIKGFDEENCLTFSLLRMPHRFSYDCWVTFVDSAGVERTHHKDSFGFWEKFKTKVFH